MHRATHERSALGALITCIPGCRFAHPGYKLIEALRAMHPDEMSPRDALEALYALKAKVAKQ